MKRFLIALLAVLTATVAWAQDPRGISREEILDRLARALPAIVLG